MACKFLNNGLAIAYQETVRPCCTWQFDEGYQSRNQLDNVNLITWHQSLDIKKAKDMLSQNLWPKNCAFCEQQENQGRTDSMRLNAASSYSSYSHDDITLEIRPGSVCNFACQTCWPAASSRVNEYYKQAGIKINDYELLTSVNTDKKFYFNNFDFLLPIAHRIKSVVLLGGEPFYDKNCLAFLDWWQANTRAELTLFTNGSCVRFDLLEKSPNRVTLVFSLDAIGKPAEYIRVGTKWSEVYGNFIKAREHSDIDVRVNITQSVYNYIYLDELLDLFIDNWPSLITFGPVYESHLNESVIPVSHRSQIIYKLEKTIAKLNKANIESGQKNNATNAFTTIVTNLQNNEFDEKNWLYFKSFVEKMDQVKNLKIKDYCPEVACYID